MDFFDDDDGAQKPSTDPPSSERRPRRRPDRRRTRVQRIAILALIAFIVVFGLAWWARSCQQNRKVASYRTYLDSVATAIDDSNALGKQLNQIFADPTKLSKKQLILKLDGLSRGQSEIAVRADRLQPPNPLKDEQNVFAMGMKVRAAGFTLLATAMKAALGKHRVTPQRLSALDAYFAGPDAYYMDLFYGPARSTLQDQGVVGVTVPTSTQYMTAQTFDKNALATMLSRVGSSAKYTGVHGVSLEGVVAKTGAGDTTLTAGKTVNVPAQAPLSFSVKVQNQGDAAEKNVPVKATLVLPDGTEDTQEGAIASIAPGQAQSLTLQGFNVPSTAISKVCTLKVIAGPVPEELKVSNNRGTFKFLLQLK